MSGFGVTGVRGSAARVSLRRGSLRTPYSRTVVLRSFSQPNPQPPPAVATSWLGAFFRHRFCGLAPTAICGRRFAAKRHVRCHQLKQAADKESAEADSEEPLFENMASDVLLSALADTPIAPGFSRGEWRFDKPLRIGITIRSSHSPAAWTRLRRALIGEVGKEVARQMIRQRAKHWDTRIAKAIAKRLIRGGPLALFMLALTAQEVVADTQERGPGCALANQMIPVDMLDDIMRESRTEFIEGIQAMREEMIHNRLRRGVGDFEDVLPEFRRRRR